MISLVQLQKSNDLAAQGWKPHEIKNSSMGGPIIMESPEGEFVQVLADGSTDPYTGLAVKQSGIGEKVKVVSRGKITGEQG